MCESSFVVIQFEHPTSHFPFIGLWVLFIPFITSSVKSNKIYRSTEKWEIFGKIEKMPKFLINFSLFLTQEKSCNVANWAHYITYLWSTWFSRKMKTDSRNFSIYLNQQCTVKPISQWYFFLITSVARYKIRI